MHLILLLAMVALVVYAALQLTAAGGAPSAAPEVKFPWGGSGRKSAEQKIAYISRGKLFCKAPGEELREVQSPHVQAAADRMERSRQLHGWKEGTSFAMSFTRQNRQGGAEESQIQAVSAQFSGPDKVLYFLKDDSVGGLFEQDLASGAEKRLVHKQNLSLEDLNLGAGGRKLLCAQHARDGSANVVIMNADGSDYREVTSGDTVDTAPAWVPGEPDMVLFQSSGIAREPNGMVVAQGPASIQLLDTAKGTLTPVLDDPQWDFMQPRAGTDGCLYYIRRPYEGATYGTRNALLDALLFPFRLLRAVFHYLNFFSLMYSRKPLTTGTAHPLQADLKSILVKGKRMDAEAALRQGALVNGVPSLVPANWQLVCRNTQGQEQVLASSAASFALTADGGVVFSNGNGAFLLDGVNAPQVLLKDKLIGEVIVAAQA